MLRSGSFKAGKCSENPSRQKRSCQKSQIRRRSLWLCRLTNSQRHQSRGPYRSRREERQMIFWIKEEALAFCVWPRTPERSCIAGEDSCDFIATVATAAKNGVGAVKTILKSAAEADTKSSLGRGPDRKQRSNPRVYRCVVGSAPYVCDAGGTLSAAKNGVGLEKFGPPWERAMLTPTDQPRIDLEGPCLKVAATPVRTASLAENKSDDRAAEATGHTRNGNRCCYSHSSDHCSS